MPSTLRWGSHGSTPLAHGWYAGWLERTVRFLTQDSGVREHKDAMRRDILQGLEAAGISIASATFEIVGLPPLRLSESTPGAPGMPSRLVPHDHEDRAALCPQERRHDAAAVARAVQASQVVPGRFRVSAGRAGTMLDLLPETDSLRQTDPTAGHNSDGRH